MILATDFKCFVKILFSVCLLFFQRASIFAQNQKVADSLVKIYQKNKLENSEKLELLRNLSFNEVNNLELSLKYADELMELSKVDGYLAKGYIDEYINRFKKAEANYIKAHEIGNSKTTFQKLYNLYLNKIKDKAKAKKLIEQFEK